MGLGQDVLQLVTNLQALLLTLVHVLPERLLTLAVAHQAGAVHLCQRALDVVVGVFHATVGDIRHMAVGAGYPRWPWMPCSEVS